MHPFFRLIILKFSQSIDASLSHNLSMEASYCCWLWFSPRSKEKPYFYPLNVPNHQPKKATFTRILSTFGFFISLFLPQQWTKWISVRLPWTSFIRKKNPKQTTTHPDPTFQYESNLMASSKSLNFHDYSVCKVMWVTQISIWIRP